MKIGYARVSSVSQDNELQVERLQEAGCDKIFTEKMSGKNAERPQLQLTLDMLRKGDTLVVTKLDRLARSVRDLLNIVEDLQERDVNVQFLDDNLDIDTIVGKFTLQILGAVAEMERSFINSRTSEGRERARKQGKHMGRPAQPKQAIKRALELAQKRPKNGMSINDIAKLTGVPRSSIYAKLKEVKANQGMLKQTAELKYIK